MAGNGHGDAVALLSGVTGLAGMSWPMGQAVPGAPQQLSEGGYGADVAMDSAGNAVAVWAQGSRVRSAFKEAGGPWLPPRDIVAAASGGVPNGRCGSWDESCGESVRVAMSADGVAVATWARSVTCATGAGSCTVVEAAVKREGSTTFDAAVDLSGSAGGWNPDVAVAPNGDAVVVWTGNERTIQSAARQAGGSFALLAPVGPEPDDEWVGNPRVAMDPQGRATVVWEAWRWDDCGGSPHECDSHTWASVHSAERGLSGGFGPISHMGGDLVDGPGHVTLSPQVVIEPGGTAVVTYTVDNKDGWLTFSVWSSADFFPHELGRGVFAETVDESEAGPPTLEMGPDGTTMLVASVNGGALQSAVRPPGGSFGRPQDLERSPNLLRPPVVAFRAAGDAVALWNDGGLRAARYDFDEVPSRNRIFNGGFERNLAEWNTSGSTAPVSLTREESGRSGGWAAKVANTSSFSGSCLLNDRPLFLIMTEPGTYTATLWVRGATAGQTLRLKLREYERDILYGWTTGRLIGSQSTPVTLTTSWQQVTVKYAAGTPGLSVLDLTAYVSGAPPGTCFYADDASLVHTPPPPEPPPDPGLIRNGWFETDLAGWNTSGSANGVSLSLAAGGHSGESAAKLTNTAATAGSCTLNDTPNTVATTAAGTYTAKLWVRADTPGQTLKLRLREYSAGKLAGSQTEQLTLATSWQQATVTYTPAAPGASALDLNAFVAGAAPGTCFFADDASLTLDATPPPPPPPPPPPDPNRFTNSGFEVDSSGWNTSGSAAGVTLTRRSGGHSGSWAAELTNMSTTAGTCTLNDAPNAVAKTAAGTYAASLWVRADIPGQTLRLRLREYDGTALVGTQTATAVLTTSWQQVTVTHTPVASGTSSLDFNAYVSGAPPGSCFWADDASMRPL